MGFEVQLNMRSLFTLTMRLNTASLTLVSAALAYALPANSHADRTASCRFALDWPQDKVLESTEEFIWDLLYWEGKFHQNDVSYNSANGMTYDGTQLDWVTGEATKLHTFSAASKEVYTIPLGAVCRALTPPLQYHKSLTRPQGSANHALQPRHSRLAGSRPLPDT